jgi:N4-(beta-N-acetylglucosaminyl)-L-asparaginase
MPQPVVIATWPFGQLAARTALTLLRQGRPALDAVVAGAQAVEDDPRVTSVGYGGLPNALGVVQLDACVMEGQDLSCGAVGAVEHVRHVTALARRVMERTPHVFLVGSGAQQFALQQGFPLEALLTPESLSEWERRRPRAASPQPPAPPADPPASHDTVAVLALDQRGNLAGACSTSGLAHKLPGRVGDSPIIGAGLYVDNTAGAAGATGVGEEILRIQGSFLITELMRAGRTPQEACEAAIRRLHQVAVRRRTHPARVAFIALDPQGRTGAACTPQTQFQYAVGTGAQVELRRAPEIEFPAP